MIKLNLRTLLWSVAYLLVVIAPLLVAALNPANRCDFWRDFSLALGFVALSMFALQFALVSRSRIVSEPIGVDCAVSVHRYMAYAAAAFALAHPIILFAMDDKYWPLLNILTSPLRAKFAVASVVALLALMVMSIFRRKLGMSYPLWKIWHWALALIVISAGLAHAVLVNHYFSDSSVQGLWILLTAGFVLLLFWMRVLKPFMNHWQRWKVVKIEEGVGNTTTLHLEPVNPDAYGKRGFRFKAGQFAWIAARKSPFSLTYNPFSISTSAEDATNIGFTIKAHQGFSAEVADLKVGEIVYIDGPHGQFHLDNHEHAPLVLIGAGVGVTPLVSMLETLASRHSRRECYLWLSSRDEHNIICNNQIQRLRNNLNLRVQHILSRPQNPKLQRRYDALFIKQHLHMGLSQTFMQASYFICGPSSLMDTTEHTLLQLGVPRQNIHVERFNMV